MLPASAASCQRGRRRRPPSHQPAISVPPAAGGPYDDAVTNTGAVPVRAQVRGTVRLTVEHLAVSTSSGDRGHLSSRSRPHRVVMARSVPGRRRGALRESDGATLAEAARTALAERIPLVLVLASSGSDVTSGVHALAGWGAAAAAISACSGIVPVMAVVSGPALSGPALLLGLADVVVMTEDAFAYLSGPQMVESFTGVRVGLHELGGASVHARTSGLCALEATGTDEALALVAAVLDHLPEHADALAPLQPCADPSDRLAPELVDLVPATANASYDVRAVVHAVADHGQMLELHPQWAPQLVTALCRLGGMPVGVVANQPRAMAGTLDIAASQKAARFVRFCDAFNLPIVTMVDTPGFLPGKDLEWRGMIRHGAELAFAYAEATVPRVCLVLRKAYGGAYIVMDSRGMGNDLCLAWPGAEIAVMGAQGAVEILYRRDDPATRAAKQQEYAARFLTPWVAAERGFVDEVVEPARTRDALCRALTMLSSHRERLPDRKHDTGPL